MSQENQYATNSLDWKYDMFDAIMFVKATSSAQIHQMLKSRTGDFLGLNQNGNPVFLKEGCLVRSGGNYFIFVSGLDGLEAA